MSGRLLHAPSARLRRSLLSVLAGGGLTAAGLLGPLPAALAAESTEGSTTSTTETTTTTPVTTNPKATEPVESKSTTTPTTTSSTTTSAPSTTTQAATSPAATTPAPTSTQPTSSGEHPTVVLKRKQRASAGKETSSASTQTTSSTSKKSAKSKSGKKGANGANNVALAPQVVAGQASALAAALSGSAASAQALDFYRIPLFLLPIYQAAAVQYDVPWQILAAINEIETDYGTDLSVSSAGAEGWMQFEPQTWLEYGVDALNAGYADPYNPVDAIFAAARYLNAAGASHNLSAAILSYNHSSEYVSSVLLRAKLIAAYPGKVIATLTGLVDDRLPVTGKHVSWGAPSGGTGSASSSTATAGAIAESGSTGASSSGTATSASSAAKPGSTAAPAPASAASTGAKHTTAPQLVPIQSEPQAKVVAVQDGRVVKLGHSHSLGRYLVLQDVYGDLFTYADLGSVARTYMLPSAENPGSAASQEAAATGQSSATATTVSTGSAATASTARGAKVRVFAHPGNPDARAAARISRIEKRAADSRLRPLRRGAVVSEGTILGSVSVSTGGTAGQLRFAIRPAGDSSTIDPRAILQNWSKLDDALHPKGAKGTETLLGATASDVFLMSKSELEREVLADPGVSLSSCSRHEVASGAIDARVLAVLAFLSRSGLKPTVGTLACGHGAYAADGYVSAAHAGDAAAIVAINGTSIAGHQGAGSITDKTIRTLLTLQGKYAPAHIISLMHYPAAASTSARKDHSKYLEVVFAPAAKHAAAAASAGTTAAHSAGAGKTAPTPVAVVGALSADEWEQLISRVAALPQPNVKVKPSSAAIPDPAGARVEGKGSSGSSAR